MGNFLDNVIKSREEWLKKPHPISSRARYLNAKLNESLVTNQEPISVPISVPISEPNAKSES